LTLATTTPTKEVSEDRATEDVSECLENVSDVMESTTSIVNACVTVLIVTSSLLLITEDFVRFGSFLELVYRILVPLIGIGMEL
jgi:hypothetical protein